MPNTIAENLQRLQTATANIATAITTKGGTVSQGDGLEEFAADIATIPDYKSTLTDLIECDITSIDIPNTVKKIGAYAFCYCDNLTSVTIPNTVTRIGDMAFMGCRSLTTITIPNSVSRIGADAFADDIYLATITINKPEGSISGAPWGAPSATVVWTG